VRINAMTIACHHVSASSDDSPPIPLKRFVRVSILVRRLTKVGTLSIIG
jgi:hypothetical protein